MLHFHPLRISDVRRETDECVSLCFDIPAELADDYHFVQGQHLTLRAKIGGEDVRRSYSICSAVGASQLRVAIKKVEGGVFSTFANEQLKPGDTVEVMAPAGRFNTPLDPKQRCTYVAFAAGSGITPVMSLIKTTLATEKHSRFILFYGNRTKSSIIFRGALEDLKNRYIARFSLHHFFSREKQEIELYNGRLDVAKCRELAKTVFDPKDIDQFYICGPDTMIEDIAQALKALNVPDERVHFERFTTGPLPGAEVLSRPAAAVEAVGENSRVTVIQDGERTEFSMDFNAGTLLEAALDHGADLPFSCKGGVCCTCRTKLVEGKVDMAINYALEPHELEAGFILACQSRPLTERIVVDFDAQ